jgi:hypothetical protein
LREKERERVCVGGREGYTHPPRKREREREREGEIREQFTSRVPTCNKMMGQNKVRREREREYACDLLDILLSYAIAIKLSTRAVT